jgi:hypothetical protein
MSDFYHLIPHILIEIIHTHFFCKEFKEGGEKNLSALSNLFVI